MKKKQQQNRYDWDVHLWSKAGCFDLLGRDPFMSKKHFAVEKNK